MAKQCICAVGDHGHEPGECQHEATESNNLCKDCHAKPRKLWRLKNRFLMNRFN